MSMYDDPTDESKGSENSPLSVYEQIDALPKNQFFDPRHSEVEASGRKILSAALKNSEVTDQSLDALWVVFRDHVRAHEYSEAIAREIARVKSSLKETILKEYSNELRAEALVKVTREVKDEVYTELREKYMIELAPHVESVVKQRLLSDETGFLRKVKEELRLELVPQVKADLKQFLQDDPQFRAEVVSDLKKRLLGI